MKNEVKFILYLYLYTVFDGPGGTKKKASSASNSSLLCYFVCLYINTNDRVATLVVFNPWPVAFARLSCALYSGSGKTRARRHQTAHSQLNRRFCSINDGHLLAFSLCVYMQNL